MSDKKRRAFWRNQEQKPAESASPHEEDAVSAQQEEAGSGAPDAQEASNMSEQHDADVPARGGSGTSQDGGAFDDRSADMARTRRADAPYDQDAPYDYDQDAHGAERPLIVLDDSQGQAVAHPVADQQETLPPPPVQHSAPPVQHSAPAVPEPLVIGEQPSFPPKLGVIPSTVGAMSGSAVPDTVLDGAELAGLTIRGGSLRGEDHRSQGIVRQDSMGIWRVNDGKMAAVLACVTDGVSSQPHSHRGAVAVCHLLRDLAQHQVSRFFKAELGKGLEILWEYMAEQLSVQLSELAVRQKMDPVTLSTTLAAAFIEEKPADPAERRYVIINVGDATAFVLRGGQFTECLADPHEGPVTESRTWTLPTSIGSVGAAAGIIGPRDMLMVCSDGMSNPMRNGNVQQQLAGWWGGDTVPDLMEFGWQLSYRAKSYGDDRTAVCVWGR